MQDVPVSIEVVAINGGRTRCKGKAATCLGATCEMRIHTPEGVCARAFAVLYPYILTMRFAPETVFERKGDHVDIVCPDGDVTFRLRRKGSE